LIKRLVGAEAILTAVDLNGTQTYATAMRAIALSHTGFNVANVILFIPFTAVFAALLTKLMPDKIQKEVPHLKFLDVRMLDTPAVGIEQSKMEILRMGENVEKMLFRLKEILVSNKADERSEAKIFHREEVLDIIQKEIVEFLSNLLSGNVSHEVMDHGRMQLRMADEYESLGDYITNILKLNLKMRQADMEMSEAGREELLDLHEKIADYVKLIDEAVQESNDSIISKAQTRGDAITYMVKQYRTKHLERVESGHISPLNSLVFTDMLTSYRRIKDHAFNIAEALAGEK